MKWLESTGAATNQLRTPNWSPRSPYGAGTVGMPLLLTLNEIVNELASWGAAVKRLSNSRGDSPYSGRIDKSRRSSLHIQADNWAREGLDPIRCQRWWGSQLLGVRCVSMGTEEGTGAVRVVRGWGALGLVIYAKANIWDWFEIGCQGTETWRGK